MNIQKAQQVAISFLSDTTFFRCMRNDDFERKILDPLSPSLQWLFNQYQSIDAVHGQMKLWRPKTCHGNLIQIGEDFNGVFTFGVRPRSDRILILDGTLSEPENAEIEYRDSCDSVFHLLLTHVEDTN